jgi:kinesin family member 5
VKAGDKTCIGLDGNCVELLPSTASGATPTDAPRFTFDHVFSPDSTQSEVYEHLGPKAIQGKPAWRHHNTETKSSEHNIPPRRVFVSSDVMNGYNSTIFAYGQTSSGKTHTMLVRCWPRSFACLSSPCSTCGSTQGPSIGISTKETVGLIPRVVFGLFDALGQACQDNSNIEVTVKVSYVEIYMETIRDLLKPTSINLELREDRERGVFIDKVESKFVTSPEELLEIIEIGSENREQAATGMNAGSSRSHSVLLITVRQKNVEDESTKQARLVLVDLAGSESVSKTGAVGLQLEEAKMINKSLSALNLVSGGGGVHVACCMLPVAWCGGTPVCVLVPR